MMFTKTITKTGMKLIKALKNVSKARLAKKLQAAEAQKQKAVPQEQKANFFLQTKLHELDDLPALEAVNFDNYYNSYEENSSGSCCCCCCCCCYGSTTFQDVQDENQRNENLENEMMHC